MTAVVFFFFFLYLTPQTKAAGHLRPKRNVLSKTENRELSQKQGSKKKQTNIK